MKKKSIIILLICLFFIMPMLAFHGPFPPPKICVISGEYIRIDCPKFFVKNFLNGSFQKQFQAKNNPYFFWNNIYFRAFNTVMYEVFKKSYSAVEEVVVGDDFSLNSYSHVLEVYNHFGNQKFASEQVKEYVDDLKFLQEYLASRNKTMIFLIEPCKTLFVLDQVPVRFKLGYNESAFFNRYKAYNDALKANGINVIDVPEMVQANQEFHIIFPKGALHWGNYPVCLALTKIIDKINQLRKGANIEQFEIVNVLKDREPTGYDKDLAMFLNLLKNPLDYEVEHYKIAPVKCSSDLKFVVIGGCFEDQFAPVLHKSRAFKNHSHYKYLTYSKEVFKNHKSFGAKRYDSSVDVQKVVKEVLDNDVIVFFMNQVYIDGTGTHDYVKRFAKEVRKYSNLNQ